MCFFTNHRGLNTRAGRKSEIQYFIEYWGKKYFANLKLYKMMFSSFTHFARKSSLPKKMHLKVERTIFNILDSGPNAMLK